MNVRDFECRSYGRAVGLLWGKGRRTVCNNTCLISGGCGLKGGPAWVTLRLYGSAVLTFRDDGTTSLDSCGFRTATTKDRINRCLPEPWRLAQRNNNWHLWRTTHMEYDRQTVEEVPFVDGMIVPSLPESGGRTR